MTIQRPLSPPGILLFDRSDLLGLEPTREVVTEITRRIVAAITEQLELARDEKAPEVG